MTLKLWPEPRRSARTLPLPGADLDGDARTTYLRLLDGLPLASEAHRVELEIATALLMQYAAAPVDFPADRLAVLTGLLRELRQSAGEVLP